MRIGALIGKFALTLFLAKYVSLENVAIYGLISGAAILVPAALSMGVAQSIIRDAAHQRLVVTAKRVRLYLSVVMIEYAILLPVVIGCSVYIDKTTPFLILAVVYLEHFGNDSANLLIATRKPLAANAQIFIRSALWIYVYIAAALYFDSLRTIDSVLLFWICGGCLTVLITLLLFKDWDWGKRSISSSALVLWFWGRFKKAKFLYASEISSNLSFYVDRYALAGALDLKVAGIYTIYSSIGMAIYNLVSSGVMQLARPRMVRAFAERNYMKFQELYKDCQKRALSFSAGLAVLSGGAFWYLFPYMDPDLKEYYGVFAFILGSVCVRVLADLKGYKLYTAKKDSLFMKTTFVSVIVSVLSNISMVPYLGILGAAYSFLITYIITIIAREYCLRRLEVPI